MRKSLHSSAQKVADMQSGRAHHNEMADDARSGSDRTLQIGDVVSLYNVDTQGYLAGDGIVDPRVMLARNEKDGHPPSRRGPPCGPRS